MKGTTALLVLGVAGALLIAASAGAQSTALPKPGARYEGVVRETSVTLRKTVVLIASKSPRRARVVWFCGSTSRPSGNKPVKISRSGRFSTLGRVGSLVTWRLKGRFVSASEARVLLEPLAICDGRPATIVANRVVTVKDQLAAAKRATARFRSVAAAQAAGYQTGPGPDGRPVCAASPDGGMGIHYENQALMTDGRLDIRRPEILVYAPQPGGGLKLVALEYYKPDADQNPATTGDRPSLFRRPFDGPMPGHHPGMGFHYDLHVWLQANPRGTFFPWNPNVHC